MNPLRVRALNYRSFPELDLEIPTGCCAVLGENGAGKSSIVNVIDLALFGPANRSWAPYLTEGVDDGDLMVELTFEHAEKVYRLRRGYTSRGRGKSTLDLEYAVYEPDAVNDTLVGWEPLTRGSAADTQALVAEILAMSRRTLRASSLLLQGDGAAFCEADPTDRKAILAEILGLDRFDRLTVLAKNDRKAADAELQRIAGALDQAELALAERPNVQARAGQAARDLYEANETIGHLERRLAELAEQERAHTAARAELNLAAAERDRAEDKLKLLEQRKTAADEARTDLDIVKAELATLPTTEQLDDLERQEHELRGKVEEFNAAGAARAAVIRERQALEAQYDAIEANAKKMRQDAETERAKAGMFEQAGPGTAHCDQCKQTLGAEALASTVASLRTHADELDAGATDLERQAAAILLPAIPVEAAGAAPVQELATVAQQLREAREAAVQGARLTERMGALATTIANGSGPILNNDLATAKATVAALEGLVVQHQQKCPTPEQLDAHAREQHSTDLLLKGQRAACERATAEKARADQQLEQLNLLAAQSADARAQREQLQATVDEIAILERAYGRDGIPAMIVQNAAIPQIEVEACRILTELGTSYRVELRTEKANQDGSMRDALDVVVLTDTGERVYETFSGGERTRINLALRIALARLLAHRRGADSRLLAIDEPEFLDEAGTTALADVLRSLDGDFDRILLVSHVPALRDSFDQVISVVKNDGVSRVESDVAPMLEGAAA